MIISDEVEICWVSTNRNYFESKGYIFTKYREKFKVKTYHLSPKSQMKVEIICENCDKIRIVARSHYNKYCASCCRKLNPELIARLRTYDRFGENHWNWNPRLTRENRVDRRSILENKVWRINIYKRDNYTCRICGLRARKNLVAHHLYNYSTHIELRHDINNGVCLCIDCHKEFHKIYGNKINNPYQYLEFKLSKNNKLNNLNKNLINELENMW